MFRHLLSSVLMGIAALLACSTLACANAMEVTVELRAESVVKKPFFLLGDVADIRSDDPNTAEDLRALRIGRSPRAGTVLHVSAPELERVLGTLKPDLRKRVRVVGHGDAVIHRGPLQTVSFVGIREIARNALSAFLAERYSRFRIEQQGGEEGPIVVPEGQLELRPRTAARNPVAQKVTVWTDIYVDGRQYQSVPVRFAVEAYLPVLVALAGVKSDSRASDGRFTVKERQVAGYAELPVPADVNLSSLRLKHPIGDGDVLTWRHVERLPVVSRNQEIRVQLSVGVIEVETVGIALQDAKPGDVIRVRSTETQQTYPARVTSEGKGQALWR